MNTRESCVNHPRGASSPPAHRPQPTNLSCAEKAAVDDGGGGGVLLLFTLAYRYD